jgi:hypothetical protein
MPTLKCEDAQRALLGVFDEQDVAALEPAVAAHLERCPQCAEIAAEQRELDVTLTAALAPPRLSPSFRAALYDKLDAAAPSSKSDALPDILHLASCAILTAVSASLLPDHTPIIVATGTIATVMSYLMLAVMRNSLDERAL